LQQPAKSSAATGDDFSPGADELLAHNTRYFESFDDVVRAMCLSQRFLGTREIVLVHHTDCGLQKVDETEFRRQLEAEVGMKPRWAVESFTDPFADVRQSMQRLFLTPFLAHKDHIRGFVYDITSGALHEVDATPD
jgi:carbonic anhydrase